MKPAETEGKDEEDPRCSLTLTTLPVFRHERLENTEPPKGVESPHLSLSRCSAFFRAMYCWIHSRF